MREENAGHLPAEPVPFLLILIVLSGLLVTCGCLDAVLGAESSTKRDDLRVFRDVEDLPDE